MHWHLQRAAHWVHVLFDLPSHHVKESPANRTGPKVFCKAPLTFHTSSTAELFADQDVHCRTIFGTIQEWIPWAGAKSASNAGC